MRSKAAKYVDELQVCRKSPVELKMLEADFLQHDSDILVGFLAWSTGQDKDAFDPCTFKRLLLQLVRAHPLNNRKTYFQKALTFINVHLEEDIFQGRNISKLLNLLGKFIHVVAVNARCFLHNLDFRTTLSF